jgi:hypothetical protein
MLLGFFILASNPAGWVAMATGALVLASGTAGVGIGGSQLALSYSGNMTAEQDAQLNRAAGVGLLVGGSPGSLLGGTVGVLNRPDVEGLESGGTVGGLTEAYSALVYGAGRMALREVQFGLPARSSWEAVKPEIRSVYGISDPALRARPNPLFWRGIERVDLSHWFAQRDIVGLERFFNRPWNITPMWATEHALIDPSRFQFMTREFKAIYGPQQATGLSRELQLAPPWMLQSGYGIGQTVRIEVHHENK